MKDDLPGMLSNPDSSGLCNTNTNPKPPRSNWLRRFTQLTMARYKRLHYTGRMLPGMVVSVKEFEEIKKDPRKYDDLINKALGMMRPEECYCKDRKCQEKLP